MEESYYNKMFCCTSLFSEARQRVQEWMNEQIYENRTLHKQLGNRKRNGKIHQIDCLQWIVEASSIHRRW